MAEAYLKHADQTLEVFSAGFNPESGCNPIAVEVMNEIGIDIKDRSIRDYREFEGWSFDYLITIGNGTREKINALNIAALHKIHLGFDEPKITNPVQEQNHDIYREMRDEICNELDYFLHRILIHSL
jgi:arsenate reductase